MFGFLFLLAFSIGFVGTNYFIDDEGIQSHDEGIQSHDEGYHGAIILKPSEKDMIREIRKTSDALIIIPETMEIHGTSATIERDGKLIQEITEGWHEK